MVFHFCTYRSGSAAVGHGANEDAGAAVADQGDAEAGTGTRLASHQLHHFQLRPFRSKLHYRIQKHAHTVERAALIFLISIQPF